MRDERQARQWPRVMFTVSGVLVAAVVTTFVVRAGGSATTGEEATGSPRTVVATIAPAAPVTDQNSEVPVRLEAGSTGRSQTDLRQIVYTIAGNQRPDDRVTIVYADETGTLQKVENVTLPWTMTVTPVVPVNYVTANSRGSQLNCWITDAGGSTVASATDFGTSTTCNR